MKQLLLNITGTAKAKKNEFETGITDRLSAQQMNRICGGEGDGDHEEEDLWPDLPPPPPPRDN